MSLIGLISEKAKSHCEWLSVETGRVPQVSIAGQVAGARENSISLSEWNALTEKLLDIHQKKEFHDTGVISGLVHLEHEKILFKLVEVEGVHFGIFQFPKSNSINLIPSYMDLKKRNPGIYIISNSSQVYLNYLALQLANSFSKKMSFRVFSSQKLIEESLSLKIDKSKIISLSEYEEACFFVGSVSANTITSAIELAEMDKTVFLLLPVDNIASAISLIFEEVKKVAPHYGKERLVRHVKNISSQKIVFSSQNEGLLLNEVLPINSNVSTLLLKENWKSLSDLMDESPENSGIIGFDQCILQFLIRRKIDIKKAFELTQNPEKFDQRLKKVGL